MSDKPTDQNMDKTKLKRLINHDRFKFAALDPQPPELCLELITARPDLIYLIRNQTPELKQIALLRDGLLIKWIRDPTEDDFLLAIKQNIQAIGMLLRRYRRTKRLFEVAPLLNYRALAKLSPWWTDSCDKHIVHQCAVCGPVRCSVGKAPPERGLYVLTEEAYITIVESNGLALEYIIATDQTEQIVWAALKQNPFALQFVKKQTSEMCEYAVTQHVDAIVYSNIKSRAIKQIAMAKDPTVFKFEHMAAWRSI